MNKEKKLFVFKVAEKETGSNAAKWEARDGVSVAGCTRHPTCIREYFWGEDAGNPC